MSLVIHYWMGDVQGSRGVSASQVPNILTQSCCHCFFSYAPKCAV